MATAMERRVDTSSPHYRRAFAAALRGAPPSEDLVQLPGAGVAERRAQATVSGPAGGYLASEQFSNTFVAALDDNAVVEHIAAVKRTPAGGAFWIAGSDDTGNEGEIGKENTAESTPADPVFTRADGGLFLFNSGIIVLPFQLLEDATFDVEAEVGRLLGRRVARKMDNSFLNGVAGADLAGILRMFAVGKDGDAGSVTTVSYSELQDLAGSVAAAYRWDRDGRPVARWLMRPATWESVQRLVDGHGRPLVETPAGQGPHLLGFPVSLAAHCPAMAAGQPSIAFGNFRRGVLIRQVQEIAVQVLRELYALQAQIGVRAWVRAGIAVQDAAAVRVYRNASA